MRRIPLLQSKSIERSHPWVYSGAVAPVELIAGEIVALENQAGRVVATAYASPQAKVRFRILDFQETVIDSFWWQTRLEQAYLRRKSLLTQTSAYRLVHAEADELPGLIVDSYDGFLILQAQTEGLDAHLPSIVQALVAVVNPKGIYERSDSPYRAMEGLKPRSRLLWGKEPPELLWIHEHGVPMVVNLKHGQKSGHYCDQRENRCSVGSYSLGKRVLDLCSNSGGFTLQALHQGAKRITAIDSSAAALEMLKMNLTKQAHADRVSCLQSDIGQAMDELFARGETFDLIILDPPKLAPQRRDIAKATKAYKSLNYRALRLLEKGGLLASFSCSSAIRLETFETILAWAAMDVPCKLRRLAWLFQPFDHPIVLHFPESEYLKGLLVEKM